MRSGLALLVIGLVVAVVNYAGPASSAVLIGAVVLAVAGAITLVASATRRLLHH